MDTLKDSAGNPVQNTPVPTSKQLAAPAEAEKPAEAPTAKTPRKPRGQAEATNEKPII